MAKTERKIRSDFKQKLLIRQIIPPTSPYTKNHEKIIDMLKASMYSEIKEYVMEMYNIDLNKRYLKVREPKPKTPKPKKDPALMVKKRVLRKLLSYDLVAEDDDTATDIQKEIKHRVLNETVTVDKITKEYLDYANDIAKQKYMYTKLHSSVANRKAKGIHWNIKPEDIIINEYCPFLDTKLVYAPAEKSKVRLDDKSASNDRFDNSKGYVKGNVWVISRLANSMKNAASIDQLKTFCYNVLKQFYENNTNYRL